MIGVGSKKGFHKKEVLKGQAKKVISKVANYSLSDDDILRVLKPKTNIFRYPDLQNVTNINQIFDPYGRAVMLFLTEGESSGHWTAFIKKDKTIEFFDPYGVKPDNQKKWLTKKELNQLGQTPDYLTNLLNKAKSEGYKIIYNKYPFQIDRGDINTCGRHILTRLMLKDLSLPQYKKLLLSSGVSPDEFVSLFISEYLGK
jgi:hypothetical protein